MLPSSCSQLMCLFVFTDSLGYFFVAAPGKTEVFTFKVRRCGLKMQVIGVSALYYAAYV